MLTPSASQIIPRTKRSKSAPGYVYCYEHHRQAQEDQSDHAASLYAVIEVLTTLPEAETITNLITAPLEDFIASQIDNEQAAFEVAIKAINSGLRTYGLSGKSDSLGRIHAVIGLIQANSLSVVRTGKAEAYLYRGRHAVQITDDLDPLSPGKLMRTFSEVASGPLKNNDRLLLTTPGLLHQVGLRRITELMNDNTPPNAAQKLASHVDNQPDANRVGAIIIELLEAVIPGSLDNPSETLVVEISAGEGLLENAKTETLPLASKVGKTSLEALRKTGSWTSSRLIPAIRTTASKTGNALQEAYNKLRKR